MCAGVIAGLYSAALTMATTTTERRRHRRYKASSGRLAGYVGFETPSSSLFQVSGLALENRDVIYVDGRLITNASDQSNSRRLFDGYASELFAVDEDQPRPPAAKASIPRRRFQADWFSA
ncbi:unnamed protein product [Nippostrongylus brasiliensis]|uniref:Pepsin-I3 domain-containing protein n=1 Tax=Nippostrongylus brasiliensis TaxID=27835 RepID=A0A0N4XE40_NIPBR|nr:unnamed protein product [Nippostrongylus brasiliensis]